MALSFTDYRICITDIKREMDDNHGWLKPNRLKSITGTPAAEVIANEVILP